MDRWEKHPTFKKTSVIEWCTKMNLDAEKPHTCRDIQPTAYRLHVTQVRYEYGSTEKS